MRTIGTPEVLVDGLGFAESPRWHADQLWFSDFYSRRVQSVHAAGTVTEHGYVPGQPSGIGFRPDGTILVVSTYSREIVRLERGATRVVATTAGAFDGPLNDMVVDVNGSAYITPMAGPPAPVGPLLMLDGTTVRRVAEGLSGPNGLVLTDGGNTLVVAETHADRLTAFDVADDGSLSGRRVFAELPGLAPDGLCADVDGSVWVGCVFSEQFVHVEPGGRVLDRLAVPGRWAVAPALGGPAGELLYCCTARTTMSQFRRGRGTAAIEVAAVAIPDVR